MKTTLREYVAGTLSDARGSSRAAVIGANRKGSIPTDANPGTVPCVYPPYLIAKIGPFR
jgi:hypothetical protein